MASIQQKGDTYYVVYSQKNEKGTYDTPWIKCENEDAAITLKEAIEKEQAEQKAKRKKQKVTNATRTVDQLAYQYMELVGIEKWGVNTYRDYENRYENYIKPHIGSYRVWDCTALAMDKYFAILKNSSAVQQAGKAKKLISAKVVNECHKFLKAMFSQAQVWGMIDSNPCMRRNATLPKHVPKKRSFWTRSEFIQACKYAEQDDDFSMLVIAMHLSVSTTMREGEIAGLQWNRCFISDEDIRTGECRVIVDRELARVPKVSMEKLNNKGIKFIFPDYLAKSTSCLVLKDPKSVTSNRTVWLPPTVARMMQQHKEKQDKFRKMFGDAYRDYDLVTCYPEGRPFEGRNFNNKLKELIKKYALKPVVFHSIRHTSTTYKLKFAQGDVKLVQGDTGHADSKMVTDVYAEIVDEDRKYNAQRFETDFYAALEETEPSQLTNADVLGLLNTIQSNPEMLSLLLQQVGA